VLPGGLQRPAVGAVHVFLGLVLAVTSIHVVGEPQCRAGVALPVVCVAGVAAPAVYVRLMAVPESREQRGPLRAERQLVHERAVLFVSLAVSRRRDTFVTSSLSRTLT